MNREALIEAITREVLSALSTRYDMAETGDKVRQVVANGADRVAFHGEAADVPLDLAHAVENALHQRSDLLLGWETSLLWGCHRGRILGRRAPPLATAL